MPMTPEEKTKAHTRACAKYDAENAVRFHLKVNSKTENDVLTRLQTVDNVNGYIKQLIREDVARQQEDI